ncbi:WD domain-containing protein [Paracoccidioides lutzii Pb01]|uniref:WD domain-containing protein n=1 Tax=Paracoccidioides lutzii (strain ATCC MYA-826 / Pb01) TaxID=502779 RepID=C1H372_PARBA|nr:WD domain-containing protein [Paracoccidioides lutzii Pb01]EEH34166.2 WD domain-containing protein [Paracoccidioides lutzii Pb01]
MSTGSRSASGALAVNQINTYDDFEPCASTASLFLYAQGSSILCLHHDTLAIERRFDRHQERIQFISVDNVSERGAGRLVVSYDASQTAIVWDIFTGQEVSRFASFEHIRVATWMKNGNVSFGNAKGEIILFEPATSEHVSARTIFDPITALAPGNDCRIYAIGYNNGSILIATIQPFTILHTLTTSRAPSSIVSLAWHASSTKQKSDMLASQTVDGDLLVWSVSKHPANETPRVIRSLKRSEFGSPGPKWIAWSKNGRIVQYAEGETWAWDVRTKHVTYEPVPTVSGVRALASYGATATLFTLGPNHTVQQYDLENPALVANVQHIPLTSLADQPGEVKVEKVESGLTTKNLAEYQTTIAERLGSPPPGSSGRHIDPNALELARQRAGLTSPLSNGSQTASTGSAHSYSRGVRGPVSVHSRSYNSGTTFSMSSPSPSIPESRSVTSLNYASSLSTSSRRSYTHGSSRLRHEYLPNSNGSNSGNSLEKPITELFPYIRSRVNNVPFQPPRPQNDGNLSPDELRKQMLNVVFGWEGDIDGLIRDELRRHSPGSQHAILLARWLGEIDPTLIISMMGPGSSQYSDWMLLALTQLGNQGHSKHLGQALVQKLLAKGDIHASAAVLLGMGDSNDAIEVYVSRNMFMEAILLTCLLMPTEWQRQSYLVRKWGEHVVQNSQQHLAIRCFACTDAETSEAWASPTAQMTTILSDQLSRSRGPTPTNAEVSITANAPRPPSRGNLKSPALKLITSFSPQPNGQFKFPGLTSADRTPTNAPGVTPIADSAVADPTSPGGFGTHRLPLGRIGRTGTPTNFAKHRLPSIGETPIDVNPPAFTVPKGLPTPVDSGSDKERDADNVGLTIVQRLVDTPEPVLLSSARYTPISETPRKTPTTAVLLGDDDSDGGRPFSPPNTIFESLNAQNQDGTKSRERKDERKAEGLHVWSPLDVFPPNGADSSSSCDGLRRPLSQNQHRGPTPDNYYSSALSTTSARSTRSTNASIRSIDPYVSSLDEATYRSQHHRSGRERRNTDTEYDTKGRGKHGSRAHSKESRGRSDQRYIQPAKRSPSSPVPMSPEDLALYSTATDTTDTQSKGSVGHGTFHSNRRQTKSRTRSASRHGDRPRNRSGSWAGDKSSRVTTRLQSPDPLYNPISPRGRSSQRTEGSGPKSPSSPLPMSPSAGDYSRGPDVEDGLRLVNGDRNHRMRSRQRHQTRRPERGTSSRRDLSPDRRRERERSQSRQSQDYANRTPRDLYDSGGGSKTQHRPEYSIDSEMPSTAGFESRRQPTPIQSVAERSRKEIAAAELEARRLSLARRPSAPSIPLPGDVKNNFSVRQNTVESPPLSGSLSHRMGGKNQSPANSSHSDSNHSGRGPSSVPIGLPATPRAMRHPKYSTGYANVSVPVLPEVPGNIVILSDAVYRPTGFNILRSASAPPEHLEIVGKPHGIVAHPHYQHQIPSSKPAQNFSHRRQTSEDIVYNPSYGTINNVAPPLLPELQHLQSPPPPPPPPPMINTHVHMPPTYDARSSLVSGVGTINIAIDDPGKMNDQVRHLPAESLAVSPSKGNGEASHRRGRSVNENFTSKIRNFTDRMRSTSRGRNTQSPPREPDVPSPYESLSIHNVIENQI